jgi:DNA-directed RNA polymerase specialized sigma24 family protein
MRYRKIRRPLRTADQDEQLAYRRRVAAALEDLGVGYGDEFVVVPLADLQAAPKARSTDPETSSLAALQNEPRRGSQRAGIIELLVSEAKASGSTDGFGGLSASKVAERLGIPLNSISTRMSECERGGWIAVRGTTNEDGSERSLYIPTAKAIVRYVRAVA